MTVNSTRLSVALCTYNGDRFLNEQLASIIHQSRVPDELIVCDDGSNDNTIAILEHFASTTSFPVYIYRNKNNLGSTKNFEQAIHLCNGDIIALADQDDVWFTQKLAKLESVLTTTQADAVFSDAYVVNEALEPSGSTLWETLSFSKTQQRNVDQGKILKLLLKHNMATGATMAFRSHVRDVILPIPPTWVHDAWIAFIVAVTGQLTPIAEPLIYYRQHSYNQIGVSSKNWYSLARNAHKIQAHIYNQNYQRFASALERIAELESLSDRDQVISQISEKMIHIMARANMPNSRLMRLPAIIRELLFLRYHRFSGGFLSCAKDLLLKD